MSSVALDRRKLAEWITNQVAIEVGGVRELAERLRPEDGPLPLAAAAHEAIARSDLTPSQERQVGEHAGALSTLRDIATVLGLRTCALLAEAWLYEVVAQQAGGECSEHSQRGTTA